MNVNYRQKSAIFHTADRTFHIHICYTIDDLKILAMNSFILCNDSTAFPIL